MSDFDNGILDFSSDEFSLESILAEYRTEALMEEASSKPDERTQNSRRIVMEAAGEVAAAGLASEPIFANPIPETVVEPEPEPIQESEPEPIQEPVSEPEPEPEVEPAEEADSEPDAEDAEDAGRGFSPEKAGDAIKQGAKVFQERILAPSVSSISAWIKDHKEQPTASAEAASEPVEAEPNTSETSSELYEDPQAEYASADFPPPENSFSDEQESGDSITGFSAEKAVDTIINGAKTFQERVLLPILGGIAALAARKKQWAENAAKYPDPGDEAEEIPEMPAAKASRFYAKQAKSFRYRGRMAFALCAILCYITFAYTSSLPLFGALGDNIRATALMCLLIEFSVMLAGIDILANGVTSALRGEAGCETLVVLSCVVSVIDSIIIAISGSDGLGIPYCAASSLSMLFAIWGSRMHSTALRVSFGTAAQAKNPYVAASIEDANDDCGSLMKFRIPFKGFVRRAEEPDVCEEAYMTAAPILIVASLALALVASAHGQFGSFFHILSALLAVSASLSGFVSFALPYSVAAKKMSRFGAAVAGYRGCEDIADASRIVVMDSDVFPSGTLAIGSIRIVEGAFTDRVIACTGSVLAASGCSIAASFTDLMRRNGYSMLSVEDFAINDGGGFTAFVQGDQVYVGTSAFMQLMGVRIPRAADSKTALYTALNGSLVGFFTIEYKPITSVQDALVSLLRGRKYPMFATRDLNISPLLLSQKFRIPTEGMDFPSFTERFEISSKEPDEDIIPAAVLTREGLAPLVEASETGTRLCKTAKLCTFLSLLGSAAGLLIMFFLCWAKSYDAASASNVITFMLLWFVPVIVTAFGLT